MQTFSAKKNLLIGVILLWVTIDCSRLAIGAETRGGFGATGGAAINVALTIANGVVVSRAVSKRAENGGSPASPAQLLRDTGKAVVPLCLSAQRGNAFQVSALPQNSAESSEFGPGSAMPGNYTIGFGDAAYSSTTFVSKGRACSPENSLAVSIKAAAAPSSKSGQQRIAKINLLVVPV
jgi:hypothetical protein